MTDEEAIIAASEAVKKEWLGRPGVTGMDVGVKYVGGKRTDAVAIRLYVRKKLSNVDPAERFPSAIGPFKTDVLERTPKYLGNPPPDNAYYPMMVGGVHVVAYDVPGSTTYWKNTSAGMFVTDNATGQLMILGTFHGELPPSSNIVYQPDPTANVFGPIGFLSRTARYSPSPIDADLIAFGAPRTFSFEIEDLGYVGGSRAVSMADITNQTQFTKRGYYTGVTIGLLDGLNGSNPIADYENNVITYNNLLCFVPDPNAQPQYLDPTTGQPIFSHGGDSGAVIVDGVTNAVSMCSVGDGFYAAGPAMPAVLTALNVTPCTGLTNLIQSVSLTATEFPSTPPPSQAGAGWGNSFRGEYRDPSGVTIRYTVTNTYQELLIQATAIGFQEPQFSWSIEGNIDPQIFPGQTTSYQQLNAFNQDLGGNVSFETMVKSIVPDPLLNLPLGNLSLEGTKLPFMAHGEAVYTVNGAICMLVISPTAVQGSILFRVQVQVQDTPGPSPYRKPPVIYSQTFQLDTQVITWP
jgi:hypothetical protein